MKYEINAGAQALEVDIQVADDQLLITTSQGTLKLDAVEVQSGVYSVLMDNRSYVVAIQANNCKKVNVNGTPITVELLDAVHLHLRELGWDTQQEVKLGSIQAQIPGLITKIFHQVGDEITEGEPIFLIEAMKMENEIKAPISGVIKSIGVSEGQTVEKGTNIIEIG